MRTLKLAGWVSPLAPQPIHTGVSLTFTLDLSKPKLAIFSPHPFPPLSLHIPTTSRSFLGPSHTPHPKRQQIPRLSLQKYTLKPPDPSPHSGPSPPSPGPFQQPLAGQSL